MRDGLKSKKFSSVELATAHLDEIERTNAHYNAFITITRGQAIEMAKASDAKIAGGNAGAIEGIPVGVKDLFCTKGMLTTAASHILDGFKPEYESTITQNIWNAGGVMLGKLNLDEFAMGSSNTTSFYGNVVNPWTKTPQASSPKPQALVPGGSSGGSAAAVAANLAPIALASSLDQAGPITRNVRDSAIMLSVMCGHDAKDSTSVNMAVPDFESLLKADVKGKKVGIPKEYRPDGMDADVLRVWDNGIKLLREAGAEIVDISLPHTKYALATYYIVAPAECSSNLARYDGVRFGLRVGGDKSLTEMYEMTRAAGFGAEVKRRIMIGTYVLSAGYYDAYYKKAQRVRWLIADDFRKAFEIVDVILTPTAPTAAFGFDYKPENPVEMYLNDVFTVPTSLAGLPAISIPAGVNKDGLPLGLQIIGKAFDETSVLNTAFALEQAVAFNYKPNSI
jgi:aspartyl-tRNA(Asn)/glutamyl-tRNA(Gln) amidotransferase subunit A